MGGVTALFAGTVALVQTDIKKVIAYSTCSQLGYMFLAIGFSAYNVAIFHLFTHAFFKSLLFLSAGFIIHHSSHQQDITRMGGLYNKMPITFALMLIGNLAITGMPLFSGYYSKDSILGVVWGNSHILYGIALFVTFLTSVYSWRLFILVFYGTNKCTNSNIPKINELQYSMLIPMVLLSLGAVFSGYWGQGFFFNAKFWSYYISNHDIVAEMPRLIHHMPLLFSIAGLVFTHVLYCFVPRLIVLLKNNQKFLFNLCNHKWYFDEIYDRLIVKNYLRLSSFFSDKIDSHLVDHYISEGSVNTVFNISKKISELHVGVITNYLFVLVLSFIGLVMLGFWVICNGI